MRLNTFHAVVTLLASYCAGDCGGTGVVAVNDLITLVSRALGNAPESACANGIRNATQVSISLIIQAMNNALNTCGSGQ